LSALEILLQYSTLQTERVRARYSRSLEPYKCLQGSLISALYFFFAPALVSCSSTEWNTKSLRGDVVQTSSSQVSLKVVASAIERGKYPAGAGQRGVV
jgi:hypothetical protein